MTLRLNGDSSGFTEIKAPNAAGDNSITLPTSNGGANQLLQNGGTAGELQYTNAGGGLHYDSSGRLLVGTTTGQYSSELVSNNEANFAIRTYNNSATNFAGIRLFKARGNEASPNIVSDGDRLNDITSYGYDGSTFRSASSIRTEVDGSPGASDMPGRLVFSTTADGSTSPTPRVSISSDGALNLLAGCPGIDFSATQNNVAGMTGETLGSYEEGQFTPTLTFGGNNTGMVFHNNTGGSYTRIGRWVYVHIRVELTSKGTSVGNAVIPNLPFNAGDIQSGSSAVEASQALGGYQLNAFTTTNGNHSSLSGRLHNNTNDLLLEFNNYATGTTDELGNGSFANNSSFSFDFMYQTND